MNKNLTPQESLDIISSMIMDRQERMRDNGHIALLWGWLVLASATLMLILFHFAETNYAIYNYIWTPWLLMPIGGIYNFIYAHKRRKKEGNTKRSYLDQASGAIWAFFGINAIILGFGTTPYIMEWFMPILLFMLAFASYIDGVLCKFTTQKIGGLICTVLAYISIFFIIFKFGWEAQMLLLIAAIICTNIIPGYTIRYCNRHE